MKNKGNGMMSATTTSSPGGTTPSANTLKNYFKTPEGRYKLLFDKSHPSLLHSSPSKSLSLVTLAHLKEKQTPTLQASTSSASVASGVRSAAARLYGSKSLSLAGGNAGNKYGGFASRSGSTGSSCWTNPNYDGKGTYLIFNVGDTIFISDLNCHDKDPIKSIHFSNSNPTCHAFDPNAKDGHDLLIGMSSGDIYSVSLRQQLHDLGKKLVGAHHYNKDGSTNNSRCTSIAWVPKGEGAFVVAHADGNLYVYEKNKDNVIDNPFPTAKDQTQFSVVHARTSKSNPTARWHICQGSINSMAFSNDGVYIATVGRDGYLRVFDFLKEQLICGGKSYYGALLCCAWSGDGKYILTGGEDDLVQVWSMEDRKVVAWGEGHGSWVSGVAFDPYWTPPTSEDTEESVLYRFGSVGQDTQLLLWDLEMNEIVVPLRRGPGGSPLGGSPSYSSSSQSSHWDNTCPVGTLQPSPSVRDVPKLSPVLTHRVHTEPLSGVVFTQDFVLTACREGHTKVWTRPGCMEKKSTSSESTLNVGSRDKQTVMVKNGPLSNR